MRGREASGKCVTTRSVVTMGSGVTMGSVVTMGSGVTTEDKEHGRDRR
jgi:hypothetical protein